MNAIPLIIITLFFVGCASSTKPMLPEKKLKLTQYYKHPAHGEISLPNDIYTSDRNNCKEKIFSLGVNINGETTTDREKITNYQNDYIDWAANALLKKTAACVSSGISSHECKADDIVVIDQYSEAKRVYEAVLNCMEKEGWQRSRTEKTYVPRYPQ